MIDKTIIDKIKDELFVRLMKEYDIEKIEIKNVIKNNDTVLNALNVKAKGEQISAVLYINENNINIESAVEELYLEYKKGKLGLEGLKQTDYTQIINEKNIILKMINYEKNSDFLKDKPFIRHMDFAIIAQFKASQEKNQIGVVNITNDILEKLDNISKEKIFEIGKKNTLEYFPVVTNKMKDIIFGIMSDEGFNEDFLNEDIVDDIPMYVMSNDVGVNGAIALYFNEEIDKISQKLNNKNLYILPSSIHELIIIPHTQSTDVKDLLNMVREVNSSALLPEEFLSNNIYTYDSLKKEIKMISDDLIINKSKPSPRR